MSSLCIALILLGQLRDDQPAAAPAIQSNEPAAVEVGDPPQAPDDSFRPSAPSRPKVEAESRPSTGNSAIDYRPAVSAAPATPAAPSPSIRAQEPARRQVQQPAEIALPATAAPATPNRQTLEVAATMMGEIVALGEPAPQNLRRVRLVDTLARIGDPSLQSTAIRAYWDLTQCIADSKFAGDKVRMLSEVASPAAETDQVLLAEAQADAEAEEAAAQNGLLAAQFNLLKVTGLSLPNSLPWPADAPLVAPYRTQFSTIFAHQPAPVGIRQIHETLPGKLSLIEKRVAAMGAAESAAVTLIENFKRGAVPLNQLLATIERLDRARRAFVQSVVDYNHQIAEYSVAVVGSGYGSETLVATLIKVPSAGNSNSLIAIPQEVRQAGASAPANESTRLR